MKKNFHYRGITFYRLLLAFFVMTFFCTLLILSQYLAFLNREEARSEDFYAQTAAAISDNISSIVQEFQSFGETFAGEQIQQYAGVISAAEISGENTEEAEELWLHFSHIYNTKLSGPENMAAFYLTNSDTLMDLTTFSAEGLSENFLLERLGLSHSSWRSLLQTGSELCIFFEKTEQMDYGRLMMAQEFYPGIVTIAGIAEDNLWNAVASCYLPEGTSVRLAGQRGQCISFSHFSDAGTETAVYEDLPKGEFSFTEETGSFSYPISLYDGKLRVEIQIPNDYAGRKIHMIVVTVLLALGIWLVCGGALSYLLSVRIYRPVEDMVSNLPGKDPLQRGFHEFPLVKRTVDDLSAQKESFEKQLEKQNAYLADNLWIRILHEELPVTEDIRLILERADFPADTTAYVLVQFLLLFSAEDTESAQEEDLLLTQSDRLLRTMLSETVQYFKEKGMRSYFSLDRETMVGILDVKDLPAETLYRDLEDVKQLLQSDRPVQISIAASSVHTLLEDIPSAWKEVGRLTDYAILMEESDSVSLCSYNTTSVDVFSSKDGQFLDMVRKFSVCLSSEQFADAAILLRQIGDLFSAPSPDTIVESTRELSYLIDTFVLSLDAAEYETYISRLTINRQKLRRQSLKETMEYLENLLLEIQDTRDKDSSAHKKIAEICAYIKEHSDDCSLCAQQVADTFHITISWLSRSFKRERNEGFLDYVHKCRIAKIQELLTTTDLSLKEIAERAGYTNYLTMSRAFKRYTGITPKLYRDNHIHA